MIWTDEHIHTMLRMRKEGKTHREIARHFNLKDNAPRVKYQRLAKQRPDLLEAYGLQLVTKEKSESSEYSEQSESRSIRFNGNDENKDGQDAAGKKTEFQNILEDLLGEEYKEHRPDHLMTAFCLAASRNEREASAIAEETGMPVKWVKIVLDSLEARSFWGYDKERHFPDTDDECTAMILVFRQNLHMLFDMKRRLSLAN